jgi:hypothetical protein
MRRVISRMVIALPTFMAALLHANPSVLTPVDPSAAIRTHDAQSAAPVKRLFDLAALRAVAIDSMRFRKRQE